jgi:hypothetical protein
MRVLVVQVFLCVVAFGHAQVGMASKGVLKLTPDQWKTVSRAFRSRDGERIARLVDPASGLVVRRANFEDHASKHLSRKEIVAYFRRIRSRHADPRGVGPLGFTTNLPKKMPRPDGKGRYFFDTGHEEGRDDDSCVRFAVKNGRIWLTEVTAWAEMGRMP